MKPKTGDNQVKHTRFESYEDYRTIYAWSVANYGQFWQEIAESYYWDKAPTEVSKSDFATGEFSWFADGLTNISYNALDRHVAQNPDKVAIIWEPNNPADAHRIITYRELLAQVCQLAAAMQSLGVKQGDRVCIYLPMVPEAVVGMLACARIGAVHSVIFAGFSATAVQERVMDAEAKLVITADGMQRGEKHLALKEIVDEALSKAASVEKCIVLEHLGTEYDKVEGRDLSWAEAIAGQPSFIAHVALPAEHPLFILYTSGSTGKPKGIVHSTGGYMVQTGYSFSTAFDYREGEVYWCTADVGWITGHSYLTYGPLLQGATVLMHEGTPMYPDAGQWWKLIEKHKVNIFYTAPTAIRSLLSHGNEWLEGKDLSSIRILGSVGEPINEEAFEWYREHIGADEARVVDSWWQTETGSIMICPVPNTGKQIPAYAMHPMPGIMPVFMDASGRKYEERLAVDEGSLCLALPWPSMARTIYGDHQRYLETYFKPYPGYYFTSDAAKRTEEGYIRIIGRSDDVINVSGHRIGTGEVEDALNSHAQVVESAVVAYPHDIKGLGIYAYVVLLDGEVADEKTFATEVKEKVAQAIGPFARPDKVQVVKALPRTRSGKIMRRILRKIAENELGSIGDTTTLLNPECVEVIIAGKQ